MINLPENVLCKTSTISNGNMSFCIGDTTDSLSNRKKFLLQNEIDFENHICMKCDHGEEIIAINRDNYNLGATTQDDMFTAEVLVTQEKGLALMLLTADCLPVSFYDPTTQTIALAHCSRKTISNNLPQKTISFLRENFSIDPSNLLIQIGPHIHSSSYSFPLPQPDLPLSIAPFVTKTETQTHIDLILACNHQLHKEGIPSENISASEIDTATSPNHFSHFRSKKQNAPHGRLATILMLK